MKTIAGFLRAPITIRLARVAVGLVMLAAGLGKIGAAEPFARQIHNYGVVPAGLENLIAMTLPWIEVVVGLALVTAQHGRSAAWLAVGALVVFDLAVLQALGRGLNIECGCFGTATGMRVDLAKLAENAAITGAALVAALRIAPVIPRPPSHPG